MKQCPLCKNTYSDNSLQFCLQDGEALYELANDQPTQEFPNISDFPTQAFPAKTAPIRIPIKENSSQETVISHTELFPNEPVKKQKSSFRLIIGLLIGFLLALVLGIIAIAGYFIWATQPNNNLANTNQSQTNSEIISQTPDETNDLKNQIANLEKQIKDKNAKTPTLPPISTPNSSSNKVTAKADSPNDGFLALRSQPSTQTGDRIMKIPHGAAITVWDCLEQQPGSKGRWCKTEYNGTQGWANDGYMIYD